MDDLVKRYRDLQISIGGCHDGYCVIRKPQGMHTNGGCNCLEDMKLHERNRIGGLLRYAQQMADRIEALESRVEELAAENRRLRDKNQELMEAVAMADWHFRGANMNMKALEKKIADALRCLGGEKDDG